MVNCLIFGTGKTAEAYIKILNYDNVNVLAYLDNDELKQGKILEGKCIDKPANINKYQYDYILICSVFASDIRKQLLEELGVRAEAIVSIIDYIEKRNRTILFNRYLKYNEGYRIGIEVGGANAPLKINDSRIIVRQVDICSHINTNDGYDRLNIPLVNVDIIDDGEKLSKIEDNSQDFIVACHFIEHCRNPIGTLRNFLNKIHSNGLILLAIPDKRVTFDRERDITDFEHLVMDDKEPSDSRDVSHIYDKPMEALTVAEREFAFEAINSDIRTHFHVWDANAWNLFITKAQVYLGELFTVEMTGNIDRGTGFDEILCVLRKK